jgi:hypothetical protein
MAEDNPSADGIPLSAFIPIVCKMVPNVLCPSAWVSKLISVVGNHATARIWKPLFS